MAANEQIRPFGLRDKVGYLFGDFGNDFTFILSSSFLLKFYTDVMAVPAATVGVIMMIARFTDAFTDIAIGRICDRSKPTEQGRFRPWIKRMCIPVALASFLIYQSALAGMPLWFKVAYLFVTYILWGSVFYTFVNIPYGSMASALSANPDDRQSLSTYRSMGGTLAGLIIGAGVPIIAYDQIGGNTVLNGNRFVVISGIFSLAAVGCYLLCYALTTERVRVRNDVAVKQVSLGTMFKNAIRNRALISLIFASIVMLLAQLTIQSMASYVYPNVYRSATGQSISTLLMVVGMLVAAAIAKPLAKRFGKAEVSVASCALAAGVCFLLYVWRPQNVWVYAGVMTICWFGLGMFTMVSWALVTDVIDDSELRHGVREDGTVYALYSFARKLGQAASAGLTGVLLGMIGYSQETAFDPGVVDGIYDISTIVPGVGFALLAAILAFWYPLHKKRVNENVEKLSKLHGAQH